MGGRAQIRRSLLLFLGDIITLNAAYTLVYLARFRSLPPSVNLQPYLRIMPFMAVLTGIVFLALDLYRVRIESLALLAERIAIASVMVAVLTMALAFLVRGFALPRSVVLGAALVQAAGTLLWRTVLANAESNARRRRRLLLVDADGGEALGRLLGGLAAQFDMASAAHVTPGHDPQKVLTDVDTLIIGPSVAPEARERWVFDAAANRTEVLLVPTISDMMLRHSETLHVGDATLIALSPPTLQATQLIIKRLSDVILAAIALVLALPMSCIVATAILLFSPGPVFYFQTRVGLHARPYRMIKFRTMIVDAERDSGPIYATRNDARLTRIGALLRRSHLDELPQLVNVLRGEMSLVGPRPERPEFVSQLTAQIKHYGLRLSVRPGVTGFAQLMGSYHTSAEDKLRLDLLYIWNYSVWLDFMLLLKTIGLWWSRAPGSHQGPRGFWRWVDGRLHSFR